MTIRAIAVMVASMSNELTHRSLSVNGIQLHVAEQGQGPLVILCHGWPELGRSWRHQLRALAAAGFHAVAPDMRGYGRSDAPSDVAAYSILHLVGDVVALVAALGEKQAYIVGHDWGSTVAWSAALMRPDLFPAVVGMSVPARARSVQAPLQALRSAGMHDFYWLYFQEPGVAEAEFERDVEDTMRRLMISVKREHGLLVPAGGGFLDGTTSPTELPAWFTQQDLAALVSEYRRTGFRGGLNWYRNMDRNWELTAPFAGATINQPSLFIAGTLDAVIRGPIGEAALARLPQVALGLRGQVLIEGAGHWINEERPDEVNAALIGFLKAL
jgi:pimeloyl-ACP methyl ester carboxylesterase